jgi:hypothetical protein
MPVFQHELRRGLLERANRPDAVELRLSGFFHHSCKRPFRFFELCQCSRGSGCA